MLLVTGTLEVLGIVTMQKPVYLSLSHNSTQFTLPMRGSGANSKSRHQITRKVNRLCRLRRSVTLYQRVNLTGVV